MLDEALNRYAAAADAKGFVIKPRVKEFDAVSARRWFDARRLRYTPDIDTLYARYNGADLFRDGQLTLFAASFWFPSFQESAELYDMYVDLQAEYTDQYDERVKYFPLFRYDGDDLSLNVVGESGFEISYFDLHELSPEKAFVSLEEAIECFALALNNDLFVDEDRFTQDRARFRDICHPRNITCSYWPSRFRM